MKKILGLDVSSSTIGWGVITDSNVPILTSYGHIKPLNKKKAESKDQGYTPRLDSAYKEIRELVRELQPTHIVIEEYAKKFSANRSSANTIIVLATFNETVALACYHELNIEPVKYSVVEMRSKVSKALDKKLKSKDDVFPFVNEYFENFKPTKTRVGNIKKEHYDEADGIFAALADYVIRR